MNASGLKIVFSYEGKKNTFCRIFRDGEMISEGKAGLYAHDPKFLPHIGRKVAFKKAVGTITDKNIRKELWENHSWMKEPLFYKVNGKTFKV